MSVYLGTQLLSGIATNTISNAHNLFDFKWVDHIINEMSWLRSDTFSWQDGSVYYYAYNHLNADYNGGTSTTETVGSYTITYVLADDGHKITTDETTVANIYNESGVAWYYILDTTNQRFKLPRTKYGFNGLRDTVGKYVEAGLPNITGSFSPRGDTGSGSCGILYANGVFAQGGLGSVRTQGSAVVSGYSEANFDASRSSSIYGNSTTVQPPATQMYLYFYVGQFSQSATEQTAGITTTQLNNKVDLDAGNLDSTGKSYLAGIGMPSDMYETISATPYTAPANGWVTGAGLCAGNVWAFLSVSICESTSTSDNDKVKYRDICWCGTAGNGMFVTTPVKKGDKVFWASANFTLDYVKFIYAEGEV